MTQDNAPDRPGHGTADQFVANSASGERGLAPNILSAIAHARGLIACDEATDLELAACDADGREHCMTPNAARAWRRMQAAASAEGVRLDIVSAFRSIDRQAEIVGRKLAAGEAIDQVLTVCAPPGFSEHHTGRAIDLTTPGSPRLEAEFEHTEAFAWLRRRACEFGFHLSYPRGNPQGYAYEPWHWCFRDDTDVA